jgi:hypothetical protein
MAAAGIPLLDYPLDYSPAPPGVHSEAEMHTNTRSEHYSHYDLVHDLPLWADFTLAEFKRAHAAALESVTVAAPVAFLSPQSGILYKAIRCEDQVVQLSVRSILQQANRVLEAASVMILVTSGAVMLPPGTGAERAGFTHTGTLRTVGEVKPSWNWSSAWCEQPRKSPLFRQYRQALAQLHYYMNRAGLRYGYHLTDREVVAVRRDRLTFGKLEVSEAVRWDGGGCGGMTVAMAIFAVHWMGVREAHAAAVLPRIERPDAELEFSDDGDDWGDGGSEAASEDEGDGDYAPGKRRRESTTSPCGRREIRRRKLSPQPARN